MRAASLVLAVQLLALCVATLVSWNLGGFNALKSTFLGGLAAWIPYFYVAWRLVKASSKDSKAFLSSFFKAEAIKLLLAVVLVIVVMQLGNIAPLALLGGFIAVILAQWAFPVLVRKELLSHGGSRSS